LKKKKIAYPSLEKGKVDPQMENQEYCKDNGNNNRLLSIIITTSNNWEILSNCLDSIYLYPPNCNYEIIVIDNGSSDKTGEIVKSHPLKCILIRSEVNLKFSKGNNLGGKWSKGSYLLLLNDDTLACPQVFNDLIAYMEANSQVGIVGPKLLNEDGSLQKSYFDFPTLGKLFLHMTSLSDVIYLLFNNILFHDLILKIFPNKAVFKTITQPADVDYIAGACMLIRASVLEERDKILDEGFDFYHEDCDLGFRMRKSGYKIVYYPGSSLYHIGGASSVIQSQDRFVHNFESALRLYKKHKSSLDVFLLRLAILIAMIMRLLLLPLSGWGVFLPSRYRKVRRTHRYSFNNLKLAFFAYSRLISLALFN
jgi:GT2 family glycosyltransferase